MPKNSWRSFSHFCFCFRSSSNSALATAWAFDVVVAESVVSERVVSLDFSEEEPFCWLSLRSPVFRGEDGPLLEGIVESGLRSGSVLPSTDGMLRSGPAGSCGTLRRLVLAIVLRSFVGANFAAAGCGDLPATSTFSKCSKTFFFFKLSSFSMTSDSSLSPTS